MGTKVTTMDESDELHFFMADSPSITIRLMKCTRGKARIGIIAPESVSIEKWIDDGAKKIELTKHGIDAC